MEAALPKNRVFHIRIFLMEIDPPIWRSILVPNGPRESLAYVPAIFTGTGTKRPDYLAAVDVDPTSETCVRVVSRLYMPNLNDELHHFGWNVCSSCHGMEEVERRFLIIPGLGFGRWSADVPNWSADVPPHSARSARTKAGAHVDMKLPNILLFGLLLPLEER